MENNFDKSVMHVIQTILSQIVDVNNHVRLQQENKELSEGDKVATTNFANYHLMVLSILLHDLEKIALDKFPDAKDIVAWSRKHYEFGLANNSFKPCKCKECETEQVEQDKVTETDKKILES
jgi:hypothetical protein